MEQSRAGTAVQKHHMGYNCCQAVVCTYCDLLGMSETEAYRAAEAFGFGVAGMRETCGSVCGMVMLAGLKNSGGDLSRPGATKRASYALGGRMAEQFREKNSSCFCRELLGGAGKGKLRSCDGCVLDGARIVEEQLFPDRFEPYRGEEY